MNESEWIPSPANERDRAAIRRRTSRQDAALVLTASSVSVAGVVALVLLFALPFGAPTLLSGFGILLCTFVLARIARRNHDLGREIHLNERGLVEEFGQGEGWLVDVIVLQGAAPTGTDRGMLWIENGRLMFSGHRTSFALSPDQTEGSPRPTSSLRGLRHGLTLPLTARLPAGRLAIFLRSIANSEDGIRLFERRLSNGSKGPARPGGQLPPTVPGPGMASRPRVLAGALVSSAYWIGVAALPVRLGTHVWVGIVLLGAVLVAYLLHLWYPVARLRAWHDLGRVER